MRKIVSIFLLIAIAGCGGGGDSNNDSLQTSSASVGNSPLTSTFSGVIVDLNNVPIAGATVTIYATNDHTEHVATTNVNGIYSVSGLQSGNSFNHYEIRADKAGYGFLPSMTSGTGTVIKADYNALYRMVIAISPLSSLVVNDANFTAYRSGDKIVSLPRTAQSVSYAVGDDASAAAGVTLPSSRFTDNHDGTITDTLTGLVWLKDAGCYLASNWSTALTASNQLANGLCGLSDGSAAGQWRLPNVGELESLIDVSHSSPALSASHPFTNVASAYWSSTTYRGDPSAAWVIRFTDGRYINDSISNSKTAASNSFWAVRAGTTTGTIKLPATGQLIVFASRDDASLQTGMRMTYPRFIDNADGTVSDTVTGLRWMKQANCVHLPWGSAIGAINALASGQCGLTDGSNAGQWRMPNRAEMLSLVDRAETNQALRFNTTFRRTDNSVDQAVVFNAFVESEFYWTSTTDAFDTSLAWTLFSCDYGVYEIAKASIGYSLAVR